MSDPITYTTNLGLAKPPAGRHNWSELANNNFTLIDAAISTFFIIQQFIGAWANSTAYDTGDTVLDTIGGGLWRSLRAHTSSTAPTTFAQERAADATLWAAYSTSGVGRGIWQAGASYQNGDFVVSGNQYAVAIVSHVASSSFSTDVIAGKWAVLVDFSLVGTQPLPILGGILDANKFAVSNSLGTGWTALGGAAALAVLGATSVGGAVFIAPSALSAVTALGASATGIGVFFSATPAAAVAAIGGGAFGSQLFATATDAQANALLGITLGPINTGSIIDHAYNTIPGGYLECNGQAVLRLSYIALFAAIGTLFGSGDGVTTFNMPNVPAYIVYKADGTAVTMRKIIRT